MLPETLLINPPHSFHARIEAIIGYVPPLGLLYLAESLRRAGHPCSVLDLDTDLRPIDAVVDHIRRRRIEVVGISVFTRTRHNAYHLARAVKRAAPDCYVVMGGPHCTIAPEDALAHAGADLVVRGEAEHDIVRLVRDRPGGLFEATPPTDLDTLPVPDRAPPGIDDSAYGHLYEIRFASRTSVISSSRGCPHRCSFCLRVGLLDYRERSPANVVDELVALRDRGYNAVIFNDDNFLANPRRAQEIAERIIRRGLRMDFAMQGSVTPRPELWHALSEAGFVVTCVGVEHVVPEILEYFRKPCRPADWPDKVARTAALLDRYHVIAVASFILGAPTETPAQARHLIEFLAGSRFDLLNSNELLFSYRTALWRSAVEAGLFAADRFHVRASELMPEKRAYLEDAFQLAWRRSVQRMPQIARKLVRSRKADKWTPIQSMLSWLWRSRLRPQRKRPCHGYGQLDEVDSLPTDADIEPPPVIESVR